MSYIFAVTEHSDRGHFDSVFTEIHSRVYLGTDLRTELTIVPDIFVFCPFDVLIAAISSLLFFVGHPAHRRHAIDHEVIGSEDFRGLVHDVSLETGDRGSDDDDRSNAYDNSYQGKERAQLVFEDRLNSDPESVGIK